MDQLLVCEIVPLNLIRWLTAFNLELHDRCSTVAQQGVVGHGEFEGIVGHFKQPLQVHFPTAAVLHVHLHQGTGQGLVRDTLV